MLPPYFEIYFLGVAFVLGAIIGSFLNVVIYRFHTGKSLSGNSHCMSCLRELRWYELFPLFSYVALRGKCRTCRSYIPYRYFLVEFLTACVFLAIYVHGGAVATMLLTAILFSLLIVVAVYDLYHYIIPDELVILVSIVALVVRGLDYYNGTPLSEIGYAILAALSAFLFYGGLWKISKGRWIGFGDAKLATPLAFLVGFPAVFSMIVLSFWVGAVVSLVLLALQAILKRGQIHLRIFNTPLKMKSEIPFAPFVILGFVLSYLYGVNVLMLISYVL